MNASDGVEGLFNAGHEPKDTELRTAWQALIRKPVITERRVYGDNAAMPSDRAESFRAWMKANKTNGKQVALKAGIPYTTLASFIQGGTRSLKGENEEKILAAFGATPAEVFGGAEASPAAPQLVRIIGRVGADVSGSVIMTTAHDSWDMVPVAPGATSKSVALLVSGHSMHTFAEDGSLIYFENQQTPPEPDMLGYPCVVETEDGRVLVKRLLKGSQPGLYDLESVVGPTIADVRLRWAAEIIAVIPARQARRIIVRGMADA